jgi:serine/threonine-protein kinase
MALSTGTRFGPYEILALIGTGGMGEVYRARDVDLGREVAIKVLPAFLTNDATRVARFEQEAKTLATLNHPNIAQIHGLQRAERTTALVLELVEGPTLVERLARGALPVDEALAIAAQVAAALQAAHEHGIVHRDLKPANIKIRPDGTVKVLDFGIAKTIATNVGPGHAALTAPAMTETGMLLGTAPYMSPEQVCGKTVDQRADVWAFGCVLYEMLSGQPAFADEDSAKTLARVLERDADMQRLPAHLPASVRKTLELCLQKDVKDRLHHIGDARLGLEGKFAVVPAADRPIWSRALPVAAAVAIAAVGTGAYMTMRAPTAAATSALPVTRFVITPPANAPLSNLTGPDLALSPDGQRLAYLGRNAARNEVALYLREFDALESRLLPGTEVLNPTQNVSPFFSPDGRSIGFAAPDGRVIRARIDGAPPLTLFQSGLFYGATWIADDTVVVATGTRLERIATDGEAKPLSLPVPNQFIASPSALPGGGAVLFMSRQDDVPRVEVLDLETSERKVLIEGAQKALYASTGHIVFARGGALMAVPFDAAARVVTGEPVTVLDGVRYGTNNSPDYALSANGTLAYVPRRDEQRRRGALVWVDRTGTVVGRAVAESLEEPADPRLSPDGTRVVATLGPFGEGQPWIYNLRGRPPVPLFEDEGANAVWSPDGQEIAFSVFDAGVTFPIYKLASSGTGVPQRIATGIAQDWSTAGDLLFQTVSRDIRAGPAAGGEARDVVATGYDAFDAALSPDERWIAYVSDRTGQGEVWVQGYPEAVAAPVRVSGGGGYEPRWSADGKELFYRQGSSMYAVAVELDAELSFEAPVLLFSGTFLGTPAPETRSYDVARDGRFLMIQPEDTAGANVAPASIVVVQNWFEELKRLVPSQ